MLLGLFEGRDEVVGVGTHGYLRDIDVAVGHGDTAEVLLGGCLAGVGELGHGTDRRCLGGLTARVGVNFGVDHDDIDVDTGGEDMIQAAVADVVRPAVAAVHPHALLDEGIGALLQEPDIVIIFLRGGKGCLKGFAHGTGFGRIVTLFKPGIDGCIEGFVFGDGKGRFRVCPGLTTHLVDREAHTEAVLGVVLKQGVGRCRAVAACRFGIREGRRGGTDNISAAGGIGNIHALAEELGHQLHVRCFAAARAGSVELVKRALELAALDGELVHRVFLDGQIDQIVPIRLLVHLALQRLHDECLFLGKAGACAASAALAVKRVDLDAHGVILKAFALDFLRDAAFGSGSGFVRRYEEGTDSRMRADERAHVAADAVLGNPHGHVGCDAAALVFGRLDRADAVGIVHKRGNRNRVTRLVVDGDLDFADVLGERRIDDGGLILQRGPGSGNIDFHNSVKAGVDRGAVHVDNLVAFGGIRLDDGLLHVIHRFINRQNAGELEESRLEHGIGAVAEADLRCDVGSIDGVEVDLLLGKDPLGAVGQMFFETGHIPVGIQEEGAAFLDFGDDVKVLHVALLVAGNEVSHRDIVGGMDGLVAEAQVALGHAAGLLGVILKVGLGILVGIVADDFDGVLVCADGSVRAETPELAGDDALAGRDNVLAHGEGGVRDIVINADREVVLLLAEHIVEHCLDVGGDGVLRGEAVAAAEDFHFSVELGEGGADISKERFAGAAGFLRAVENADALDRCRQGREQVLCGERTVEVDLNHADLFALCGEVIHDFQHRLADGAHGDDHALGIGCAVVVEELVISAGEGIDGIHLLLDNLREGVVSRVAGLAGLEEGVRVLQGGADGGVLGVQSVILEVFDGIPVNNLCEVIIIEHVDLLDFVAGAEPVKEMHKWNGALDGAQMRHRAEIHTLLHACGSQLGKARLAAGHGIGMVAEDGNRVRADGSGSHVHDTGEHGTRNAVHRRDHQHQALGSCVGGSERARLQSAVHGTAGTCLALQLYELNRLAEQILFAVSGPAVNMVGHRAGRRNGIDRSNFGKRIACVCGCLVAVHGFFDEHNDIILLYRKNYFIAIFQSGCGSGR